MANTNRNDLQDELFMSRSGFVPEESIPFYSARDEARERFKYMSRTDLEFFALFLLLAPRAKIGYNYFGVSLIISAASFVMVLVILVAVLGG